MIPVSNGKQQPCSPISSNCVIWQGPDLPCINLCKGDTVSDVIAKMATELCNIIDEACQCEPDLTGLDLKCVLPSGDTPPQTLVQTIQLIIDYLCELNPGGGGTLPIIQLPPCLYYVDPLTENTITALPLDQYAAYLAGKMCNLITSIQIINQTLIDFETRITVLENCVLPCTPSTGEVQVISQCIIPGSLVKVSVLLSSLESAFCNLQDATGDPAAISQAINQQCLYGTTPRLSGVGNYGSLPGWQGSPSTLAQSVQNLWIAVCDMYSAITNIQENCCDTGCDGVTFGFTYTVNTDGAGIATSLNLNFTSSILPPAYNDCGGSTLVTITDSAGNSVTQAVNVKALSTNPAGTNIPLAGLNVYQSILVNIPFCVTDGINLCSESRTQIVPLQIPCPTSVILTPSISTVDVSFTNVLGTGVTYVIKINDTLTGILAGSTTISLPGGSIFHTFTGLASGTSYTVTIEITSGGVTRICPGGVTSTVGESCADISSVTVDPGLTIADADIVLGYSGVGPGQPPGPVTYYGYNIATNKLIVDTFTQDCGAPIISMGSLSVVGGNVSLNLALLPLGNEVSIITEYSSDNVTWTGTTSGPAGVRVISTGITSGQIYIRAKTECIGPDSSIYTKIMYNYGTNEWLTLSAPSVCTNPLALSAVDCPYGDDINNSTLACGSNNYTVPGFSTTGKWFYFGVVYVGTTRYYAYAGWSANSSSPNAVYRVVLCCECPAFILGPTYGTGILNLVCAQGQTISFDLEYVLGDGAPVWNIVTNGYNGTFTYNGGNNFSYTHNNSVSYGDTMTVNLSSTASCSDVDYVLQVQIIPCTVGLTSQDQDIFAFIDTNTINIADGPQIASALNAFGLNLNGLYGWTGQMYIIPVTDSEWLGYAKGIVDDGVSAFVDPSPIWASISNLPTSWVSHGGTGALIDKTRAFVIAFSNSSYSEYHDSTLAAGWGSGPTLQPTVTYQKNYLEYVDMITGSNNSAWAMSLAFTDPQFPNGFTGIYYPINNGPANATAAAILQGLACYTAEMIQPQEYGVPTAVDVTAYLMSGVTPSATNPYQGFSIPSTPVTIQGLFYPVTTLQNASWVMFLDQKEPWDYDSGFTGMNLKLQSDLEICCLPCSTSLPTPYDTAFKIVSCTPNGSGKYPEYYVDGNFVSIAPWLVTTYAEITNTSAINFPNWNIGTTQCFRLASYADSSDNVTINAGPFTDCSCV